MLMVVVIVSTTLFCYCWNTSLQQQKQVRAPLSLTPKEEQEKEVNNTIAGEGEQKRRKQKKTVATEQKSAFSWSTACLLWQAATAETEKAFKKLANDNKLKRKEQQNNSAEQSTEMFRVWCANGALKCSGALTGSCKYKNACHARLMREKKEKEKLPLR